MWSERYRPQTLKTVLGEEDAKPLTPLEIGLANISSRGTIDTHLLFYGQPGTGKTTSALAIARHIYGKDDVKTWVMELNASDERGIDVVRGQITSFCETEALLTRSDQIVHPYKLLILDEADAMTPDAQRDLRHIMEKHATTVRFIFMCNFLTQMHPAIRSRCFIFRFPPHPLTKVLVTLGHVATEEAVDATPPALESVAHESKGDMRKAIHLLQAAWISKSSLSALTPEDVYHTLGKPSPTFWKELYENPLPSPMVLWETHLAHFLLVDVFYSWCEWVKTNHPLTWISIVGRVAKLEQRILAEGGSGMPVHRWAFVSLMATVTTK